MDSIFTTASGEVRTALVATTTVVATLSVLVVIRAALYLPKRKVIPSPLHTVMPKLSKAERENLLYVEDSFPGARDVSTPYGSIRVYEWGPESGPRVLFVHGISTPCSTCGPMAHAFVKRGYRVMLFDLFGRGFSDGVGDLPHDNRLYATQALLAMASSPVSWTGTDKIRLVGYSMGAGVAVHLSASFPHMVSTLILVAPAGLIRATNFGLARHVFQSGLVPERLLAAITKRRLQQPISSSRVKSSGDDGDDGEHTHDHHHERYVDVAVAEAIGPEPGHEATRLEKKVVDYVQWMLEYHDGFVPALMSCFRFGPLTGQQDAWAAISKRKAGTTAIYLGKDDEIIDLKQFKVDALPLIGGKEHVRWRVMNGTHDVVMTHAEEIMRDLDEMLGI